MDQAITASRTVEYAKISLGLARVMETWTSQVFPLLQFAALAADVLVYVASFWPLLAISTHSHHPFFEHIKESTWLSSNCKKNKARQCEKQEGYLIKWAGTFGRK